jgi:Chitobiase/beta-hexosaminidase C-terminal domain
MPPGSASITLQGEIESGRQPIQGAKVQAYAAGTNGVGSAAQPLVSQPPLSDNAGHFSAAFSCTSSTSLIYVVATGGSAGPNFGSNNNALSLMTVIGPCNSVPSAPVLINEVTTIGSIWPYSSYMTSIAAFGSDPNDVSFSAADTLVNQLIDLSTGISPGSGVPNGYAVQTAKLYTLADALQTCTSSSGGAAGDGSPCGVLFSLATPSGSAAPTDTIGAALRIAKNPSISLADIFGVTSSALPFQPGLLAPPSDWSLPLVAIPAPPEINPESGTYGSGQQITVTETSASAVIHYTTDGSQPSGTSPIYTDPLVLSSAETVNAIAIDEAISSAGASEVYSLSALPVPTFSPLPGTYSSAVSVTINDSDPIAVICYTTDGSSPSASSTRYTGPISVSASTNIRTVAVDGGLSSPVVTGTYTLTPPGTPIFSPAPGSYAGVQTITITDSTPSAVYYTTDGSTPTTSSTRYSGAISLSASATIRAIAIAGPLSSAVASGVYTIGAPLAPTLSPAPGTYSSVQTITLFDADSSAAIYYTTDGSTPSTASTRYSGPISFASSTTISAIAIDRGLSSPIAGGAYTINPVSSSISLSIANPAVAVGSSTSGVVTLSSPVATDLDIVLNSSPLRSPLLLRE